ncbi:MAG: hypothetical protein OEZ05_16230 [Nitrospirota bacterium]|nr:hypothetical protein [Nitrospirota bacterium]MDH5588165.1 hypothetical protein [Nitrospirota bacterium]
MKKTIMVHLDGIPTHPFEELDSRTVLQAAQTPCLDDLARHGELGRLGIPKELRPFTGELAFLGLLGYDTPKWFVGPGSFEGINLEVVLDRNDVAFLCDFVTLRAEDEWGDGKKLGPALVMDDISGGGLETEEARELIDAINEQLVSENIQFYLGHQARHLMVWVGGNVKICCRNPQEALGQSLDGFLPVGESAKVLCELMEASRAILRHHPVNQERVQAGLKPANCLWPWGPSKPVELSTLKEQWSIQGSVVSQCGPYRGVAMASGLQAVNVEEHGENTSEWLQRVAGMASKILEKQDLACLHIPFGTLASSQGSSDQASRYVETLEQIDEHLLRPLQQSHVEGGEGRLFVVATPCRSQSDENESPTSRYVLSEGQKADGSPTTRAFHDQDVLTFPLQNAAMFFERFFGKK